MLIRLYSESKDEYEALPPRTHSPFRSDPLSSFILEFLSTFEDVVSISPVLLDHGFHTVRDRKVAAAWRRGKPAVYVHLEGLEKLPMWAESVTSSSYSEWPLNECGNDHAQAPPKVESLRFPVFWHHIPETRVSFRHLHSVPNCSHARTRLSCSLLHFSICCPLTSVLTMRETHSGV